MTGLGRGCVKTPNPCVFGGRFGIPKGAIVQYRAIREVEFGAKLHVGTFLHSLGRARPWAAAHFLNFLTHSPIGSV